MANRHSRRFFVARINILPYHQKTHFLGIYTLLKSHLLEL